jgi:hypothetical protein
VARDRKRAKRRRDRRGTTAGGRVEGAQAPPPNRPVRADLPGSLDHAGDVDEFDAALVRGAGGVTATPEAGLEDDRSGPAESEAGVPLAEPGAEQLEDSGASPP